MDKNSLKEYLSSKYQGPESFLKEIIFPIFGDKNFEDGYETEVLDMQPERRTLAEATGIRSVKQLGCIYIGVDPLYIFDITVADRVLMQRNRVGIQRLVRMVMDNFSCAFMVFHYDDAERWDWRFTFCQKKGSNSDSTDSKRYTFLLGPGQSCRTARDNFWELHEHRDHLTVQSIEHAFSVEVLSNEFFDKYKQHYEDIILYVTGKRMIKSGSKWVETKVGEPCDEIMQQFARFENPEKAVRDYVKKLMGRLVFLQFLQKKGWLGVPVDKEWGEGEPDFSQKLFERCNDKDHFIDDVLELLFNDLNTEREGDISKLSALNSQPIKVPYLNGGLFERDTADEAAFPLPSRYMQDLLDFFAQYNFTIDENDPNDAEVGVDPEMLGRIFENLLEDNKDKGVYYTPKEIVQYMCRESLTAYLQNDIVVPSLREAIRQFVATKDVELLGSYKDEIDQRLRDVKICDPAIGSGAFPMGLLREIYFCRAAIEGFDQQLAAEIKKHIIQQNIYGVDLERGAVDIARLRFWLSLVVDEATPHALPNLDFKIMQGNSLLEQYEGIDLSLMSDSGWLVSAPKPDMDLFGNISTTQLEMTFSSMMHVSDLQSKIQQYFSIGDYRTKVALFKGIEEDVRQHILYNVDVRLGQAQRIVEELEQLSNLKPIQQKELARMQETVARYQVIYSDVQTMSFPNNKFFLWHTYFKDVFDKGGFDIVIGNPPYVEAKKLKYIANTLKEYPYQVYAGTADLSVYFIELGLSLLCTNGIMSLITTNKFFNTQYGKLVRRMLSQLQINKIINFEQVEVFEDILVSSVIMEIRKISARSDNRLTYERFYQLNARQFREQFVKRLSNFGSYPQKFLNEDEWSFADLTNLLLKDKIENGSSKLEDLEGVKIYRGVTTGFNPAFIINGEQKNRLIAEDLKNSNIIKTLLQGRNIRKWYYNESDEYLLHTGFDIDIPLLYPHVYSHLLKYENEMVSRSDQGKKWWNLRACQYYSEFERPLKIIWGLTADKWAFALDEGLHYLPSNGYILTSTQLSILYILGILNSKLMRHYFGYIGVMTAGGAYTLKGTTISALPFRIAQNTDEIANIVEKILQIKGLNHNADVSQLESSIDLLVYHLYGLNYDEVLIVDPDTPLTREEYENETRNDENDNSPSYSYVIISEM